MKQKQNLLNLCFFWVMLLLCVTGCKKRVNEFPKELIEQIKQDTKKNEYNFVIASSLGYDSPVIRYNIDGKKCFMLVDTGATGNSLIKNGIEKVFPGMKFPNDYKYSEKIINGQIEGNEYILDPYNRLMGFDNTSFDGVLGLTWMKKKNNIVIDFVNNKILFNQEPITEDSIPLIYNNEVKWYKIPFMFNGNELSGFIDTGCYCTMVNQPLPENRDDNGVYIVKDFSIGSVHYENIKLSSIKDGKGSENAYHVFSTNNVLGYPCFKDHIIQLDFKNSVFRIK